MRALRIAASVLVFLGTIAVAQDKPTANPSDKAIVYVYRYKQFVGSALAPSVYCDEVQLARMENGRYFALNVDPGQHQFRSNDAQSGIQLDVKAGHEYFIRVEIAAGFMKGHGRLVLTAPEQGRYELQSNKLNPLDADKVVDHSHVLLNEAKFDKPLPAPEGKGTVPSPAKTAGASSNTQQAESEHYDSVTLSDNAPDATSQMSLGDAARKAREKKAASNGTAQPQ